MLLHGLFEALGWIAALAAFWWTRRRYFAHAALPMAGGDYPLYTLLLWLGAVGGAYALGSLNIAMSGVDGGARSILGAVLGGILVAEPYKALRGIRGSTGAVFVLPLAAAIAIGRIGCFLAGLADFTYGTPTALPWGIDFGDGVPRHPVQLYESLATAAFAAGFVWLLERRREFAIRRGFYLFALYYGAQRFLWEFFKPYATVAGPFNLFHLASLALVFYALVMLQRQSVDVRNQPARL